MRKSLLRSTHAPCLLSVSILLSLSFFITACSSSSSSPAVTSTSGNPPRPVAFPTAASFPADINYSQTALAIPTNLNDPYLSSTGAWLENQNDLWGFIGLQASRIYSSLSLPQNEIIVAVIDTGTDYTAPDLDGRLWVNHGEFGGGKESNGIDDDGNGFVDDFIGWNWIHNNNNPIDDAGHGTHVAGSIAAIGGNAIGIVGVAPWVRIMSLKVCDYRGRCSASDVRSAIRYAADMGAKVINLSLGGPSNSADNLAFDQVLAYAENKGALVVSAAGNSSQDVMNSVPANSNYSFTVSAHANDGLLCSTFSNFGLKIDISAPGCGFDGTSEIAGILSINSRKCGPSGSESCCSRITADGQYCLLMGTSMAAPHASGLAALALTAAPVQSPRMIRQALLKSAALAQGQSMGEKNLLHGWGLARATDIPALAADAVGLRFHSPRYFTSSASHDIQFTVEARQHAVTYRLLSIKLSGATNIALSAGSAITADQTIASGQVVTSTAQWSSTDSGTHLVILEAVSNGQVYRDTIALQIP
jgi:subtilisin family serine protease